MLTAQQIEAFERDGYVKGPQVLGADEVALLRQEVLDVLDRRDAGGAQPVLLCNLSKDDNAPVWQIVNIYEVSEAFGELVSHPVIVAAAAQLIGASELRIWHDQIQYKPAAKGGVNMWHQDSPLWPILQPKDQQVTAWVALDDVDEDNGCMSMVPGSHKWGDQMNELRKLTQYDELPTEFQGRKVERRLCPVAAGQVHFHHSLTWHGSHANRSGRPRRAIALHYMSGHTTYDARGEHVMKPFVTVASGDVLTGDRFPRVYPSAA